jgi:hypothetical protein
MGLGLITEHSPAHSVLLLKEEPLAGFYPKLDQQWFLQVCQLSTRDLPRDLAPVW